MPVPTWSPTLSPSTRRAAHAAGRRRAFTLLELIVVIVVLGLLAALAIPTFAENVNKSHDEVAQLELEAMHEEAWALHRLANTTTYDVAFFREVEGDYTQAAGPGVFAQAVEQSEQNRLEVLPAGEPSTAHGFVSFGTSADGDVAGLAMLSRSGRCAWVKGVTGQPALQGAVDLGPDQECLASTVVDGLEDPPADPPTGPPDPGAWPELVAYAPDGDTVTVRWRHSTVHEAYQVLCWDEAAKPAFGTGNDMQSYVLPTPAYQMYADAGYNQFVTSDVDGLVDGDIVEVTWNNGDVYAPAGWVQSVQAFTTYTCQAETLAGVTATGVLSNEAQVTPLLDIEPLSPPQTPVEWLPAAPGGGDPVPGAIPEPVLDGGDTADEFPAAHGPAALASMPSTHTGNPHRLYVTMRDSGAVVVVPDEGVGTPSRSRVVAPAGTFNQPAGILAGQSPGLSVDGFSFVYDTLYIAETGNGTISRMNPTTGSRTQVASGLTAPVDLAGFACFEAGVRTSDLCLYAVTGAGVVRANLTVGTQDVISPVVGTGITATVVGGVPYLAVSVGGDVILVDPAGATVATHPGLVAGAGLEHIDGDVWAADAGGHQISTVAPASGTVTDQAGDGTAGSVDGTGTGARFNGPVDVHNHGNSPMAYILDGDGCVRRMNRSTSEVSTLWCAVWEPLFVKPYAGTTSSGSSANGLSEDTTAQLLADMVAYDGWLYMAGGGPAGGPGTYRVQPGSGAEPELVSTLQLTSMTTDGTKLYGIHNRCLKSIDMATGATAVVSGTCGSSAFPDTLNYTAATMPFGGSPNVSHDGTWLWAGVGACAFRIDPATGNSTWVNGMNPSTGTCSSTQVPARDGAPATSGTNAPGFRTSPKFTSAGGYLWSAEDLSPCLRRMDPTSGVLSTPVGKLHPTTTPSGCHWIQTGTYAYAGDYVDATGNAAHFKRANSVAALADGTLLVADSDNAAIRAVDPATLAVSTWAGGTNSSTLATIDGPRATAGLYGPWHVTVDPVTGDVYWMERANASFNSTSGPARGLDLVRWWNPDDDQVRTLRNLGRYSRIYTPLDIEVDGNGDVWTISSTWLTRTQVLTNGARHTEVMAGGATGTNLDGNRGANSFDPKGLALHGDDVWVLDAAGCIRHVDPTTVLRPVSTVGCGAGDGQLEYLDGKLYSTDEATSELRVTDPVSGATSTVHAFGVLTYDALEAADGRLWGYKYASAGGGRAVWSWAPGDASPTQQTVTGPAALDVAYGIALAGDGKHAYLAGNRYIYKVELAGGGSARIVGDGTAPNPTGAVQPAASGVYVAPGIAPMPDGSLMISWTNRGMFRVTETP